MVRSRYIDSPDSHTCVELPDGFKVHNRYGEDLFGTEGMDTSPHPLVPRISLANNDESNIMPTNNDSITFNNNTVI